MPTKINRLRTRSQGHSERHPTRPTHRQRARPIHRQHLLCILAALAFALCLPCLAQQAQADPLAAARQAIESAHVKIDTALDTKDYAGVTAACTPGFISINEEGRHFNAADVRAGLAHDLSRAQSVHSVTTVQSVTLTPAGATITLAQHLLVATHYRVLVFGRLAHTTLDQSRREDWIKTNNTWQLKQSRTLSSVSHTHL